MEDQKPVYNPPANPILMSGTKAWMIVSAILLLVVLALAFMLWRGGGEVSREEAGARAINYINAVFKSDSTLKSVSQTNGVFEVIVTSQDFAGQEHDTKVYISQDGELYFPQGFRIDEGLN